MQDNDICIITKNYVNPLEEGQTQASKNIVDSILASGLNPLILSLGYPLSLGDVHISKRLNKNIHVVYDLMKYSNYFRTLKIEYIYWKTYDLLKAIIVAPLVQDSKLIYLINVSAKIYSPLIKVFLRLKQKNANVISHVFHSVYPSTPLTEHRFCDFVFCTSEETYRYFSTIVKTNKAYHVPYPINTNRFKPRDKHEAKKLLALPLNAHILGYIGHITPERGIFDLVQAFRKLIHNKRNLMFVIVAPPIHPSDTPIKHREELMNLIHKYALKGKVKIIEKRIPAELFYNAVDILALPFQQPYLPTDPPVTLIEAMASETPLITTPVGAISEVVDESRALFVRPGDVEGLKDAIEYLIDNERERKRLGRNAREYVVKNLSLEVIGRKLKKIFDEILEHG